MKTKIKLQAGLIIAAIFLCVNVFSQGMYINAGSGYGFPAAPYLMADNIIVYSSGESGSTFESEIVKGSGSFGKGIQVGAVFGYMFNKNMGAELGINYLIGSKIESKREYKDGYWARIGEITESANMLRFTPSLKITTGNGNLKPYLKAGLVIGVASKILSTYKTTYTGEFDPPVEESEYEMTGGISFGFTGALGADFMFSKSIGIFAEIGIITQSWAPKKRECIKFTIGGQDHLDDLTTSQREVEFVESASSDSDYVDEDIPRQELKTYYPFSSVDFNVGIKISLGGS